jgi:hypothetical protein
VDNRRRDVYVLVPKEFTHIYGERICEHCYDGYGNFGGYDIYDLVVDWNRRYLNQYRKDKTFVCDWLQNCGSLKEAFAKMEKREIGISIACYDEDNERIHYPIKITHDATAVYEDCEPSKGDPNQGWYEPDDYEYEPVWSDFEDECDEENE